MSGGRSEFWVVASLGAGVSLLVEVSLWEWVRFRVEMSFGVGCLGLGEFWGRGELGYSWFVFCNDYR